MFKTTFLAAEYIIEKRRKSVMSDGFVCLLGVVTVFVGLICIILIVELMHFIISKLVKDKTAAPQAVPSAAAVKIENRGEIIAAVSAALAEELGEDVSAIRILSFKKIN